MAKMAKTTLQVYKIAVSLVIMLITENAQYDRSDISSENCN